MERDAANASVKKAAQNLQEAIMSVRKVRQSQSVVGYSEHRPAKTPPSRTSHSGHPKTRTSMWLQDEYLESSCASDMDDGDVSVGSTMSDHVPEDNQLSACSSPTTFVKQDDTSSLNVSSEHCSTNDSAASTTDPHVHTLIDQIKFKLDGMAQLKDNLMHACNRVDAFVCSTTGYARLGVQTLPTDLDTVGEMVSRWDRDLAEWKRHLHDDIAHKCRREVMHIQQTTAEALRHQQRNEENRVQMAMEDNFAASVRWQERLSAESSKARHERVARKRDAVAKKRAEERHEMAMEDLLSRLVLVESRLRQSQKQVETQVHANAMLRLQVTSIDTRLEEALKQVQIEQEIANHVQATQQHEIREIEALNYKLLTTLVQQDENLQLKEAAMHHRVEKLEADRAQLAKDQVAFELQKNLILKELKGVCDYFSNHCDTHPVEVRAALRSTHAIESHHLVG
ncbi:hypothetical protein, variant [Aphanomyces invadans]|uniref:Uncharacterized protein n=1 Tax=Aphanomyces invadans TaxID=157072 RepID=A0A024U0J8_9STRA|nr:hypothetical protein, variant [Aphanomyces invadans]ETV99910.1 hypothetical protein, variant [Aphanomyces invadans]|eukprot:XP_008871686.1 hypothetical protein, variant [Aphanomyces invadans]